MTYARVWVELTADHLGQPFDYRVPPALAAELQVGSRVEVTFAGRRLRGLVTALAPSSKLADARIRNVDRVLGPHVWVRADEQELVRWVADRFASTAGAVLRHALPERVADVESEAAAAGWFPPGAAPRPSAPPAPAVDENTWKPYGSAGRALRHAATGGAGAWLWRPLPGEDLAERLTELACATLAGGRDVIVTVPEPVSRVADRLVAHFRDLAVDVRGGPSVRDVYRAWLAARCGKARVVVGERRVALWPVDRLGLAVVVDEASPGFKERRAPRYHARDVLLRRAEQADAAVAVLTGTVPSALAWRLLAGRQLRPLVPVRRAERAAAPVVRVDDRADPSSRGRLGRAALDALRTALEDGELGVVLAARRGEGRALVCRACGARLCCPRCDGSLAIDRPRVSGGDRSPPADTSPGGVLCEGCGWETSGQLACRTCGSARFAPLAAGAHRLGAELRRTFPRATVAVLEGYAQAAPPPPAVVVTTRGSTGTDPPGRVGAVVLPDLAGQLRRPTLDAAEDALRVAMRTAGWTARHRRRRDGAAGRGAATVVVQTPEPAHHAVQALVRWDPGGFWRAEVSRRAALRFPPVAHAIRVEVVGGGTEQVVDALRTSLPSGDDVLGPRLLPTAAGAKATSRLLVKADDRQATLEALAPLRATWSRQGLDVRVDVDPIDVP